MKKNVSKKWTRVACALVAGLFVFSAAGCASSNTGSSTAQQPASDNQASDGAADASQDANEAEAYPIGGYTAPGYPMSDGSLTLTIWRDFTSTIITGLSENRMYQEMEKATGVKINWISPPSGQKKDNYNLRIASNDLPDIFYDPDEYTGGIMKAVDDGVYVDLTPMMEEYAPNYMRWLAADPQINKEARLDDGRILALQQVQLAQEAPWFGPFIRTDLLDKAGLPMPETIEDWYNTLTVFKNELGIAIPLGQQKDSNVIKEGFSLFSGAFQTGNDKNFIVKDGKAVYGYMEDQYREFLVEMNKWYREGLFDPEFDTRTYDDMTAQFAAGKMGAIAEGYGDANIWLTSGRQLNPEFTIKAAPYPVMNKGDDPSKTLHIRQENYMVRGCPSYVTTACKTPELAVKWLDFSYSVPGFLLNNYGVEGESWEWVDGEDTEDNTQYFPPEMIGIGKHPEFTEFMLNNPDGTEFWTLVQKYKTHNGTHLRNPNAYYIADVAKESMEIWSPPGSDWFVPQISYNSEEQKRRGELKTDIETYRDTMIFKFVKGTESLDKWDEYIANMKKIGIDEYTEMAQTAIDRYNDR